MKMKSLAIPKFKTFIITPCYITYLHYDNNKKGNIYIKMGNPPLERLWDGQYPHISQQKIIVSHVICEILRNMKKLVH
jgi:hypothetical protein